MIRFGRTLLGLALISASTVFAHEDAILKLKDGKIEGLPEEFQPATFDAKTGVLRIGALKTTFPSFLVDLFSAKERYDLEILGSWYHEKEIMPYYISFRVTPRGRDFSYHILFNLETLKVIKTMVELRETKDSIRELEVIPGSGGTIEKIHPKPTP